MAQSRPEPELHLGAPSACKDRSCLDRGAYVVMRRGWGSAQHVRLSDDAEGSEGTGGKGKGSPAGPGREEVHEPKKAAIP